MRAIKISACHVPRVLIVKMGHMIFWALNGHRSENNKFSDIHGPFSARMSSYVVDDDCVSTEY